MPVYIYRCPDCGHEFEKQQSYQETPLQTCPKCGRTGLRKVYTPTAFVFHAKGFYTTDHRAPIKRR